MLLSCLKRSNSSTGLVSSVLQICTRSNSSVPQGYVTSNPKLKRSGDQHDITNLDLIEERFREKAHIREITVGGQTQKWAYRSEIVNKLGLDNNHRNIWVAYGLIIIFGFSSFVYVKSNVVMSRKEEMEEREKIRKSLNLLGSDRKKVGIVDN